MKSFFDRNTNKASFGKEDVVANKKKKRVQSLFNNVAPYYDLMNDLMSLGLHRQWKKIFVDKMIISPQACCLDLAGGTGDIAKMILSYSPSYLVICDLAFSMIYAGCKRLKNTSCKWVCGDAQALPFQSNTFDLISMAYGLRNVTDIQRSVEEIYRVLKPGGVFYCMEFSDIVPGLESLYDFYSFKVIPLLGRIVANDSNSYNYLVESIRRFPNHKELALLIKNIGFVHVTVDRLCMGITAIHIGYKGL